ncbi:MAG TPA: type I polyketide synthase, partial [Thermoanaerobaculia bacterium]|nr:type I polyketide synthase [Thermoanaerobaculia bacterium]
MSESDPSRHGAEIAVVGMALRFPGAASAEAFWDNLRHGRESITFFSDAELAAAGVDAALLARPDFVKAGGAVDGIDLFDPAFFDLTPREAELMDPQHRLLLECAWEAVERAGYDPGTYPGLIGLFAGANTNTYQYNVWSDRALSEAVGRFQLEIGNEKDHLATQISYKLNLRGPSLTVQTGCSTSLVAVHLAVQSLLGFECDLALAGGVSLDVPQVHGYLYQEGGVLSPDGHCRAFDAAARGTVAGSGAGFVVLKRLDEALAGGDTVLAVIKGSAINNDGSRKVGYTAPSVAGQAEVIEQALAMARLSPADVSYVEAHGTGTVLGDPIEVEALQRAFRAAGAPGSCALGTVKSNIGHLNTAAGVAGLIKTVLMLRHRQIPPSLHFERPNPQIDFSAGPFFVSTGLRDWQPPGGVRRAGVSSFGIGGTNAHVVLEEAPAPVPSPEDARPCHLLVLSARTAEALEQATANLRSELATNRDLGLAPIADIAYTLQVGRQAFAHRRAVVARDLDGLDGALQALAGEVPTSVHEGGHRPVAFLFPGQGAQYAGMGQGLYHSEPLFRREVDRCAGLLAPHLGGLDLRRLLFPAAGETEEAARRLAETALAQPALFAVEYALGRLWMEWIGPPQHMLGHSVGEYVAACLAGTFELEEALALVAERGRLMQEMPPGAMLAVPLPEAATLNLLDADLSLAAVNAPDGCVVAGPLRAVERLERWLEVEGVEARRLPVARAFHSALVDAAVEPLTAKVAGMRLSPPAIPWISNLTGRPITAGAAVDPAYWGRHLRQPVRFSAGVAELLSDPDRVLLEVGPGDTLGRLARRHPGLRPVRPILSSLGRRDGGAAEDEAMAAALGRLWRAGVEVSWPAYHAGRERRRVPLPTYPFERRRYWIELRSDSPAVQEARTDPADRFYMPTWKRTPLPAAPAGDESSWLLIGEATSLRSAVAARLRNAVTAEVGPRFARLGERAWSVRIAQREDYAALLGGLEKEGLSPARVLHLGCFDPGEGQGLEGMGEDWQERGFYSLLAFAQAVGDRDLTAPLLLG